MFSTTLPTHLRAAVRTGVWRQSVQWRLIAASASSSASWCWSRLLGASRLCWEGSVSPPFWSRPMFKFSWKLWMNILVSREDEWMFIVLVWKISDAFFRYESSGIFLIFFFIFLVLISMIFQLSPCMTTLLTRMTNWASQRTLLSMSSRRTTTAGGRESSTASLASSLAIMLSLLCKGPLSCEGPSFVMGHSYN